MMTERKPEDLGGEERTRLLALMDRGYAQWYSHVDFSEHCKKARGSAGPCALCYNPYGPGFLRAEPRPFVCAVMPASGRAPFWLVRRGASLPFLHSASRQPSLELGLTIVLFPSEPLLGSTVSLY